MIIKKLAELAKEEGVVLDYYIGPHNVMTIRVYAKFQDFVFINPLSFNDDEIIEITKDAIRRAKDEYTV